MRVLLVEKTKWFGGATALSGGGIWIPGNRLALQAGFEDSAEIAARYLRAVVGEPLRGDILDAYLAQGPRMFEFFQDRTEARFGLLPGQPDYFQNLEGARTGGRLLGPHDYDGRKLGGLLTQIRLPLREFNAPAGFMIGMSDLPYVMNLKSPRSLLHVLGLAVRYGLDRLRYSRGTRLTMGNALIARLLCSAVKFGVTLWHDTPLVHLIRENGRVAEAEVMREGRPVRVRARCGIVLASGGFSASADWRKRHLPYAEHHVSMMPDGNTGDGLACALSLGAKLEAGNFANAAWTVMSVLRTPEGVLRKYPHVLLDRPKPGCIAVNRQGRRFVNEAAAAFVDAMHATDSVPAYLVCDRRFVRKYGLGLVFPGGFGLKRLVKSGYIVEAPTLAALAERLGLDVPVFEATVARYNDQARRGDDLDFGKGRSTTDRSLGDPSHVPNPCLAPLEAGPFYAVKIFPGDGSTTLGLRVDADARVVDSDDAPIPGLYAAGLDMNYAWRGREPSHGSYNGLAMTFGYIAAQHILRNPVCPGGHTGFSADQDFQTKGKVAG